MARKRPRLAEDLMAAPAPAPPSTRSFASKPAAPGAPMGPGVAAGNDVELGISDPGPDGRKRALPKDVRLQAVPGTTLGGVSFVRAPGSAVSRTDSPVAGGVGTCSVPGSASDILEPAENTGNNGSPFERDDLLARLNFSAADERRKALLERLRAIDKTRSDLAAKTAPASKDSTCVAASSSDAMTTALSPSSPMSVCISASASTSHPRAAPQTADSAAVDQRQDASAPRTRRTSSRLRATSLATFPPADVAALSSQPAHTSAVHHSSSSLPAVTPFSLENQEHETGQFGMNEKVNMDAGNMDCTAHSATPSSESDPTGYGALKRPPRSRVRSVMISGLPGESDGGQIRFSGVSKCKTLAFCKKLVNAMLRKPTTRPFSAPVEDLWPPDAIPRYFDVIAHPMDLGTIKRRLDNNQYLMRVPQIVQMASSPVSTSSAVAISAFSYILPPSAPSGFVFDLQSFCADVRLCFRNCMVYCPEQDVLFRCAKTLMEEFDEDMLEVPRPVPIFPEGGTSKKSKREIAKESSKGTKARKTSTIPQSSSRPESGPSDTASVKRPAPRRPKSRKTKSTSSSVSDSSASDLSEDVDQSCSDVETSEAEKLSERLEYLHRCRAAMSGEGSASAMGSIPMTFEEKTRLTTRISSIPVHKVSQLVAILAQTKEKGNNQTCSDEIEVDMDKLDCQTLRKVEALVDSCVDPSIGGKFKPKKVVEIDLSEFDSVAEIDGEIAALSAQLDHAKAASSKLRSGGLWDDSSSSDSDNGSSGDSSDGDSSDESDPE